LIYTSLHLRKEISEEKAEVFVYQSRLFVTCLVFTWTSLGSGRLAAQSNPNQPTEYSPVFTVPAGAGCSFAVEISAQGRSKTIMLPGDRMVINFPGVRAAVKNLDDPAKQLQNINVTGVTHTTREPDGSTLYVVTGRNLNVDPVAGIVLSIGRFSFVLDASGNLLQPLKGKGQLVDLCALLE
jgi:hypothetical protein